VVKQGDDYVLKTVATIVENDQDKHCRQVPDEMIIGQRTEVGGARGARSQHESERASRVKRARG
jgi:hypothetical protein